MRTGTEGGTDIPLDDMAVGGKRLWTQQNCNFIKSRIAIGAASDFASAAPNELETFAAGVWMLAGYILVHYRGSTLVQLGSGAARGSGPFVGSLVRERLVLAGLFALPD